MTSLNDIIIRELQRTDVKNLSRLINYIKVEKGFFYVRSAKHDHWRNGTAQHSWRVYKYMRYLWEHPEEIPENRRAMRDPSYKADPALAPDKVRQLTEKEIILAGLLHDVGKMQGCDHHAAKSKKILDDFLGTGFSQSNPKIVAAIFFHHRKDKDGGFLNQFKHSTLRKLLSHADSMAAGTAWNSTRFLEQRSQRSGIHQNDIAHMRRVAMDRTRQVLYYRMFLDSHYDFHTLVGYGMSLIQWNVQTDLVQQIKSDSVIPVLKSTGKDVITELHDYVLKNNGKVCLVVCVEMSVIMHYERNLRQNNAPEEELLICSNILNAFYQSQDIGEHRYSYQMRSEVVQCYKQQSSEKGILLPQVTFFRDGVSRGFRMVEPWQCDVLLVPGWKGCMIVDY